MAEAVGQETPAETQPVPKPESSDQSLMRRYRGGSQSAARKLYLRYADRLRALAKAKCSPDLAARVDADDIVQSVFRSFFQAASRGLYEVPAGEELWKILMVIALNKIRSESSFHRAAKRDVRLTAAGQCFERALAETKQDDAADVFFQLAVKEALESLPPQHRQTVELRIQGYEVAQIAATTGRSKRSIERLLQEARKKLDAIFHECQ